MRRPRAVVKSRSERLFPARMTHLKVFALATVFGLGAYAVILGLIHVSRATGFLEWIMR
jgi:hypothetical protein